MLEGVLVVGHVVVVIVGIGKETVACGKDIAGADIGRRQMGLTWVLDDEEVLVVVGEILAELVAEVGVGVAVADNLHWFAGAHRTMVGGYYHAIVAAGKQFEEFGDCRMAEPTEGDTAISRLGVGQLAHHLRLGAGMTEHVDEIEHHNIDVVLCQLWIALKIAFGTSDVVHLIIREGVVAAETLYLCADEGLLVDVLAFLLVFIHPKVGEHARNVVGHKSAEDGIAGILCGGGQDAAVELLVDVETVGEFGRKDTPLVVAEIIEDDEEDLLAGIDGGEDGGFEEFGTQHRARGVAHTGGKVLHPLHIVGTDILGKALVGFFLLHGEHLGHLTVGSGEFEFPMHQAAVDIHPILPCATVHDCHGNALEVLLITRLGDFGDYLLAVDILLERKEYLVGIDGLDEIIGYLRPDGLIHNVFLLTLGDHHHWHGRRHFLDALEGLQPTYSGHHLVEEDKVETPFTAKVDGVVTIAYGDYLVAFLFQKEYMGTEKFYLVIHPQQSSIFCHIFIFSFFAVLRMSMNYGEECQR